jgi:hypothetical protein
MRSLWIAFSVLCFSSSLFAQSDRGTITGTISDPGGLVIAGAPIEVANVQTGAKYQVGSSTTGNYVVQVPTGTYEMSVTVSGFKKYIRPNIVVPVEQTLRIDVTLEIGSNTESITINDSAPLLKTESGELSHNIASDTLNELPVLGIGSANVGATGIRSVFATTQLIPGAYWNPDNSIRVNGLEGNSASLRVEGQDATNTVTLATISQNEPSVEAVQEFAIQTSNYAAEFGQAGGGLFNITMKSGTNQFHGTGYDYFVDEFLNAGVPFTNNGNGGLVRPEQRRNDYGASLSGPIFIPKVYNGHDKTFFFINFEQFRENVIVNDTPITVPTLEMRQGNFSQIVLGNIGTDGLGRPILTNTIYDPTTAHVVNSVTYTNPYPNNAIPFSQLDPVALKIQALIPLPTNSALVNNYLPVYADPRHSEIPSIKIDHSFNSSLKLSGYYSETRTDSPDAAGLAFPLSNTNASHIRAYTTRLNLDYIITPTLLLHFGAGYVDSNSNPEVPTYNNAQIGFTGTNANEFPFFSALSGAQGGMANMGTVGNIVIQNVKPTSTVSLTWVRGNHTYKAGGEVIVNGFKGFNQTYSSGYMLFSPTETGLPALNGVTLSNTVGFAYASFLIGAPNTGYDGVPAAERLGNHSLDGFVQDSWKVTRKLTIDYGLRYDFETYLKEHNGYMFEVGVNTPNPAAGGEPGGIIFEGNGGGRCNCEFAHNYPYAFGPRLGLAYQMLPKTVLRIGGGISYAKSPDEGSTQGNTGSVKPFGPPAYGVPPFTLAQGLPYQITFPDFYAGQQPLPGTVGNPTNEIDPQAGRPARIAQWSIGVQHELAKDLLIEATYVGNVGVWWAANTLTPQASDAISVQRLASYGLSLNNAANLRLLASPVDSALAASSTYPCTPAVFSNGVQTAPAQPGGSSTCNFGTAPYPGFPTTLTVEQSLRPFPEYTGIVQHWVPLGDTWYDALQAKMTKRFSHGLEALVTYTWSKSLALGAEDQNSYTSPVPPVVNDVFNRPNQKTYSGYDQPQVLIFAPSYTTPKIIGTGFLGNKAVQWITRDWTIGAILHYASGLLIKVPTATSGLATYVSQGTNVNINPGVPFFTQNLNCGCFDPNKTFVLNPAAWSNPAPGQFGDAAPYYNNYRNQRHPTENVSLARTFRIKERVSLQLRAEFTNIFNRVGLNPPTSGNAFATQTTNAQGQTTGGFGWISTAVVGGVGTNPAAGGASSLATPPPRQGQLVARFSF